MNDKKSFVKGALYGALIMLFIMIAAAALMNTVPGLRKYNFFNNKQSAIQGETETKLNELGKCIDEYFLFNDKVDEQSLVDGIYAGYVSGLGDPYSVYYNEEQTKQMMESTAGEYCGIGAGVIKDIDTGAVMIGSVYKDSPAEEAGLMEGDYLYQVDDHVIQAEELTEIVSWIKGEEGTEVTLHVYRGEELEEVTCKAIRRYIEVQTVEYEMKDDKTAYLRILEFDTVTYKQFNTALEELEKQGMEGLVIDLRSNPGGNLDTTVDMLKKMLPKGMIVYTDDKKGQKDEYVNEEDHRFNKPLAVLVNQNSASASEIFAGAIQDYGVGTIVGKTTFGKGIVQRLVDLRDGTSLKITVSEYYLPSGRSIHEKGITPDVEVEYEYNPEDKTADNQLDKAMEVVQEQYK